MSISGAPAFVETMKVFTRERLNGYYPVGAFAAADALAGAPFIALIALLSAVVLYFISNLNYHGFGRFVYFVLNLYAALLTAESLIMCLAPLVTHFLMLIAIAAGRHVWRDDDRLRLLSAQRPATPPGALLSDALPVV
jgi:hypothetical protein